MNLCTVSVGIAPEVDGGKPVSVEYHCCTGGYSVARCMYYKPMVGAGGLVCHGECHWFHGGCTCQKAQQAAKARAVKLLARWCGSGLKSVGRRKISPRSAKTQ